MNKTTTACLAIALVVWPGVFVHARPVVTESDRSNQYQRAAEPVILCSHQDSATRTLQPCAEPGTDAAIRVASDLTRQQVECVLSGKCEAAERGRVSG